MKKFMKWSAGAAVVFGVSLLGGAAAQAAVSAEQARSIALEHAGVSASDVNYIRTKEDWDWGRTVYEIEFYAGTTEYDYDIDKDSGEILKADYEEHYRGHGYGRGLGHRNAGDYALSYDEAAQKALAQVPGATQQNLRMKRDHDKGRPTYEGEIRYGGYEYEFEMDASTGDFIEWKSERDDWF